MQLMQPNVQKWTRTTLPRSAASVVGSLLIQAVIPVSSGAGPRSSSGTESVEAAPDGRSTLRPSWTTGCCSIANRAVLSSVGSLAVNRAWNETSRPVRTTIDVAVMASPKARRRRSARRGSTAAVARRPQRAIAASGMTAPTTYAVAIATASGVGPDTTAAAMTAAMIGPTHGAQIEPDPGSDRKAADQSRVIGAGRGKPAVDGPLLDRREDSIEDPGNPRPGKAEADQAEHDGRAQAQPVGRDTERREGGGEDDGDRQEGRAEADEDSGDLAPTTAGRTAEDERDDRQGARRQDREQPGDECEGENDHDGDGLCSIIVSDGAAECSIIVSDGAAECSIIASDGAAETAGVCDAPGAVHAPPAAASSRTIAVTPTRRTERERTIVGLQCGDDGRQPRGCP